MNLTPIRDLVKKTHHLDPKKLGNDSFTYVDISSVDKDTKRITEPQTLLVGDAPSRARKEIKVNDVLVATVRPNLNGVAIVPPEYDNQIASTGFCVLRVDPEQLDPNYLFYFTQTETFISHLTELSTGAGYPAVSDEDILDTRIPFPPLTEQKRIASLLARADRLRQLRQTGHDLGDALLQSVFLEMSEKARGKMKEVRLETLAEVKTGGTPTRDVPEYFGGQIPWIKTTEVVNEVIYDTSEKISEAGLKASNCEVFPVGTILVAMYGQGLTRGRTGKLGIPATTNQACAAILPSSKINTDYLWTFLKLSYNEIRDLGRGGNQPNLNLSMVRDLVIPVPPLSLQEEFAGVVRRVESLRGRMSEAGRQVDGLFESVLSESFGG